MQWQAWGFAFSLWATLSFGTAVPLIEYPVIEVPVTPFSNMASGYQATNPGFRLILRSPEGRFLAGGRMTMDAVINGYSDDASSGSAYGKLVLKVDMEEAFPSLAEGIMSGTYSGLLSICMAQDPESYIEDTQCKSLSGNIHPDRPFQWIDKKVDFEVNGKDVKITRYYGNTGEGGTSTQLSLVVYHPAFGFAAPGKAFKDYQSPLVLDLNYNGKMDLVNVWADKPKVHFDFRGTGENIRTGWVKATDGFLFWDNGTGCVSSGQQLFGEYFHTNGAAKAYKDGFEALSKKLDPRATGKVIAKNHARLKIWRDLSQDGICQKKEVVAASKFVKEIYLSTKTIEDPPLNEDNEVRVTGEYLGVDGKRHLIGDVFFKQRRNEIAKGNNHETPPICHNCAFIDWPCSRYH